MRLDGLEVFTSVIVDEDGEQTDEVLVIVMGTAPVNGGAELVDYAAGGKELVISDAGDSAMTDDRYEAVKAAHRRHLENLAGKVTGLGKLIRQQHRELDTLRADVEAIRWMFRQIALLGVDDGPAHWLLRAAYLIDHDDQEIDRPSQRLVADTLRYIAREWMDRVDGRGDMLGVGPAPAIAEDLQRRSLEFRTDIPPEDVTRFRELVEQAANQAAPILIQPVGDRWFSYDPGGEFQEHDSPMAAKASADAALDDYRDYSREGWDELAEGVRWGRVYELAREVDRQEHLDGCTDDACADGCPVDDPKLSHACDYRLAPPSERGK